MRYSKGIMWLDDCRIPFVGESDITINHNTQPGSFVGSFGSSETKYKENTQGRFTPNLLVCDDMLNDGSFTKTKQKNKITKNTKQMFNYSTQREYPEINDKGTNSRYYDLDLWFDKMLERL